jgi:hypothetical protein
VDDDDGDDDDGNDNGNDNDNDGGGRFRVGCLLQSSFWEERSANDDGDTEDELEETEDAEDAEDDDHSDDSADSTDQYDDGATSCAVRGRARETWAGRPALVRAGWKPDDCWTLLMASVRLSYPVPFLLIPSVSARSKAAASLATLWGGMVGLRMAGYANECLCGSLTRILGACWGVVGALLGRLAPAGETLTPIA